MKSRWGGEQAENDEGKMRSQENWKKDSMLGTGVVAGDALMTRLCRKSFSTVALGRHGAHKGSISMCHHRYQTKIKTRGHEV